jgi:hypothetical protein
MSRAALSLFLLDDEWAELDKAPHVNITASPKVDQRFFTSNLTRDLSRVGCSDSELEFVSWRNQALVLKKSLNKMPFNLGACPRPFSCLRSDKERNS